MVNITTVVIIKKKGYFWEEFIDNTDWDFKKPQKYDMVKPLLVTLEIKVLNAKDKIQRNAEKN